LHRYEEYRRIWEEMGRPEVNVKELKALIKKQEHLKSEFKRARVL